MASLKDLLTQSQLDRVDTQAILGFLIQEHLQWPSSALFSKDDIQLPESLMKDWLQLHQRRLHGEPVAYLVGTKGFYNIELKVNPHVLIPRPETELLVEIGLSVLQHRPNSKILDLGTGSGAIALALAVNLPNAQITATDISSESLMIASQNATSLNVSDRCHFIQSSWFKALDKDPRRYDFIVSNPPYIPNLDPHLIQGDLRFEPQQALTDFADGLEAYRQIIAKAGTYIQDDGVLALEHGFDQSAQVCELLEIHGFTNLTVHHDLAKIPRAVSAKLR